MSTPTRRRRHEADHFRRAILGLRKELGWSQATLATRLGVSERTLSNWECGYWLPPFKQRLHIVVALSDVPPEHVLELADALSVNTTPAVAPLLQPYRDALGEGGAGTTEPARRAPPDPAALRAEVDTVVREAADAMNVSANELRAAVVRIVGACAERGATLEELSEAVAVRALPRPAARKA